MTSSNGNIFRVSGYLCGEFTGPHRSPVNSSHKGQWRGALMFYLICVWINGWVNNREAGDLRRYRAHYDVTVMCNNSMSLAALASVAPLSYNNLCKHISNHNAIIWSTLSLKHELHDDIWVCITVTHQWILICDIMMPISIYHRWCFKLYLALYCRIPISVFHRCRFKLHWLSL